MERTRIADADDAPPAPWTRPPPARSGDGVDAIETPALVVDLDAMERNIERLAAFATRHRVRLRPHAKTHKCAAVAQRQIAAGAVGVCVQKAGEALALGAAGLRDVYISNPVVDAAKLARVAQLAGHIRLAIAVDSVAGSERLAQALAAAGSVADVFVEIDVGQGRCGVEPAAAGALARQVVAHGLRLAGLQAYHGRAQHLRSAHERAQAIGYAAAAVRAAEASMSRAGLSCPLVTGAGTGSFLVEATSGVWGELQAGSYVFMDRDYADNEPTPGAPVFEHALFVKSQVTSRGLAHAVVDAGHKSHAIDSGLPRVWQRELDFANGGDEHGILRPCRPTAAGQLPAIGETVWLVPGHCDPTVNLHDHLVAVRGGLVHGTVAEVWRVDARGRVD
jgi:D-serine deaminase-like pyridoxal phosphate-dependent protein